MNLSEVKSSIISNLTSEPQRQAKAAAGIASIEAGIAELAALGYSFAAVESNTAHSPETPIEFPKMLYRSGEYPTEITVDDEEAEADARSKGYVGRNDPEPVPVAPQPTIIGTKADVKNVTQAPTLAPATT